MAEKYTPNKPKDAGLEARQKLGWWHAYRFLILTSNQSIKYYFNVLKRPDLASLDFKKAITAQACFWILCH